MIIACPFDATENFWRARRNHYSRVTKSVVVVAAFRNEEQASLYKSSLKKAGIRSVRFDKMGSFAEALKQRSG